METAEEKVKDLYWKNPELFVDLIERIDLWNLIDWSEEDYIYEYEYLKRKGKLNESERIKKSN